jgi:small nuclear ribonucleoprotein (snRNP)-like protein
MSDNDPIDFTSPQFDAAKALADSNAAKRLPCPNAKTFNNLDQYFQKTFKKQVPIHQRTTTIDRQFTEQQKIACLKPVRESNRQHTNVLSKMNRESGPLTLLSNRLGKRVRILIRRRKVGPLLSQFAWLNALLAAFDKHLNLVIYDVDEMIRIKHVKSTGITFDKRERHSKQLFVRGDNVIIVSLN